MRGWDSCARSARTCVAEDAAVPRLLRAAGALRPGHSASPVRDGGGIVPPLHDLLQGGGGQRRRIAAVSLEVRSAPPGSGKHLSASWRPDPIRRDTSGSDRSGSSAGATSVMTTGRNNAPSGSTSATHPTASHCGPSPLTIGSTSSETSLPTLWRSIRRQPSSGCLLALPPIGVPTSVPTCLHRGVVPAGYLYPFTALWGQFLDRYGEIKPGLSEPFSRSVANAETLDDLNAACPYEVLATTGSLTEFRRRYGV